MKEFIDTLATLTEKRFTTFWRDFYFTWTSKMRINFPAQHREKLFRIGRYRFLELQSRKIFTRTLHTKCLVGGNALVARAACMWWC